MADLDSRSKRASAIGIDLTFLHLLPNPDSTIDQGDRQHNAFKYSGINASAPAANTFVPRLTLLGVG